MRGFVTLSEIVEVMNEVITRPVHLRIESINSFKATQYAGAVEATQIMMQNDCVWVTETPDQIMSKHYAMVLGS